MSRITSMSRGGWIVIGVLVGLLIVPSGVAVAVALKYTGIEGSNGITTTLNKAGISSTGQLLTGEADPNRFFQSDDASVISAAGFAVVATPPSGSALVITSILINTKADPTPGSSAFLQTFVESGTTCNDSSPLAGNFDHFVNPATLGEDDISLATGLVVPSGDALCMEAQGGIDVTSAAAGYTVPATDISAGPIRSIPRSGGPS
jgi:hypothetical protein